MSYIYAAHCDLAAILNADYMDYINIPEGIDIWEYFNRDLIYEAIKEKRLVSWNDVSNHLFDCAIAIVDDVKSIILMTCAND